MTAAHTHEHHDSHTPLAHLPEQQAEPFVPPQNCPLAAHWQLNDERP